MLDQNKKEGKYNFILTANPIDIRNRQDPGHRHHELVHPRELLIYQEVEKNPTYFQKNVG